MRKRLKETLALRVFFAFLVLLQLTTAASAMSRDEFQLCRNAAENLSLPAANMQSTRCLMQAFLDLKKKNEAYLAALPASALPVRTGLWVDGSGHTNRVKDGQIMGIVMPKASNGLDYDIDFSSATIPTLRVSDLNHHISFSYDMKENKGMYMDVKIPLILNNSELTKGTNVRLDGNDLVAALNKVYEQLPGAITMAHFSGKILQDPKVRDTLLEVAAKLTATRDQ